MAPLNAPAAWWKRPWLQASVLMSAAFVCGAVVGGIFISHVLWTRLVDTQRDSGQVVKRMIAEMQRDFDLSHEQRQELQAILEKHHEDMRAVHDDVRPKIESLMDSLKTEVEGLLTAEQAKEWNDRYETAKQRWLPEEGRQGPHHQGAPGLMPEGAPGPMLEGAPGLMPEGAPARRAQPTGPQGLRQGEGPALGPDRQRLGPGMQPGGPAGQRRGLGRQLGGQPHSARADTDGDGLLTLDEMRAVIPHITEEWFDRTDADSNGSLNQDELRAAGPPPRPDGQRPQGPLPR